MKSKSMRYPASFSLWTLLVLVPTSGWAQTPTECYGNEAVPLECFLDVQCPQFSGYHDVRRAVVHISGPDSLGTGVLINNVNCKYGDDDDNCGIPYLLTAAHLVTDIWDTDLTEGAIYSLENGEFTFTLAFSTPFCGGAQNGYAYSVAGSKVLGWSIPKDLLLLRLETSLPPEAGPYFVGWGADGFDEVAAIGHACGGPQKIAIADPGMLEYQTTSDPNVNWWHVWTWDAGGLSEGSSGAPLFAESGGLLGIFSQQDVDACAGDYTDTWFAALTTIVPFLGEISNGWSYCDAHDPNDYLPIYDVVTNDSYYGEGDVVEINATQKVTLSDGFGADAGSSVHVIIVPVGP